MWKAKDATRCDKLRNLIGSQGECALRDTQKHARMRINLLSPGHGTNPAPVDSDGAADSTCSLSEAKSSRNNSSEVRKPSGFTTGMTFWSSTVSPRYQRCSSWQNAAGKAWSIVIMV